MNAKNKPQAAHTPGPWTYEASSQRRAGERESVDRFVIGTPRNERGGRFVTATIEGPFCGERDKHEADARLIAAAPDLLAALKGAIHKACASQPKLSCDKCFAALAAIARAEGK